MRTPRGCERALAVVSLATLFVGGCRGGSELDPTPRAEARAAPTPALVEEKPPEPRAELGREREHAPPEKGREIAIPAGTLRLGSPTGSPDRNPSREADDIAVEVPAFSIDALPHPNDPAAPFTTGVSRAEAEKLCEAEGKRLCSEFEWERACKGDENQDYPSAPPFDAGRCAKEPLRCVSPFGVYALGVTAREWTRDTLKRGFTDAQRTAVVRGAAPDAEPRAHRCASRDAATPDSKSATLTFRCCRGPAPELTYPTEPEKPAFEELDFASVASALASMPETRGIAGQFRPFSRDEVTRALQQAGYSRTGMAPWQPVEKALAWRPMRGEDVRIIAGDTPEGALLVVYYPLADGRNLFAGSYKTAGEHTAIVVAYKVDVPDEVLFSTCWGCGGEGGAIQVGADNRVEVVPR